jgi:uncharacterized membrane protein
MAICQSYTGEWLPALSASVIRICCLVTLILCSPTSTADELEGLSVTAVDGEFSLQVAVVLNAPVDYVYKVITDYKNAYRINPAITNVEILPSGHDDVVRVRNLSEQCVGPFCFDIAWAGDITETGDGVLKVKTLPGLSDFVSGSASWHIRPQGERTLVLYESKLKPAFFIPPVIGDSILKNHIKNDTLATFKRIECQAMIMLAVDMAHQPDDFEQLSKEGKECINPLG